MVFSLVLAGPFARMLAWIMDIVVVMTIWSVIRPLLNLFAFISIDFASALSFLLSFALTTGYSIMLEWLWNGQTIGKRMLRLRVIDESGGRLQFAQVVVRNLLRMVDVLPGLYFIGGTTALLTRRAQRLGDLAAGTVVIRQPRSEIELSGMEGPTRGKYNSIQNYPYLEARLRSTISAREVSVALAALLRRDRLDDTSRIQVFEALAAHFKEQVDFPDELLEGLSDEQLVSNVVSTIYSSAKPN